MPEQALGQAVKAEVRLTNDAMPHLEEHVRKNAARHLPVVPNRPISEGKTLVLCGFGPSLAEHIAEYAPKADELWACNASLNWLIEKGYQPTHAISVDPTLGMLDDWRPFPDVTYYVASTCHPTLIKKLAKKKRRVFFFHNNSGIEDPEDYERSVYGMPYETYLYKTLFPNTWEARHGLNVANRATCLALVLGFTKIYVLGADCALKASDEPMPPDDTPVEQVEDWLVDQQVYARPNNGDRPKLWATPTMAESWINGRRWLTRIDMAISAHCFYIMKHHPTAGPKIELVGDTLPNAIMHMPHEEVRRIFPAPTGEGYVGNMTYRGRLIDAGGK